MKSKKSRSAMMTSEQPHGGVRNVRIWNSRSVIYLILHIPHLSRTYILALLMYVSHASRGVLEAANAEVVRLKKLLEKASLARMHTGLDDPGLDTSCGEGVDTSLQKETKIVQKKPKESQGTWEEVDEKVVSLNEELAALEASGDVRGEATEEMGDAGLLQQLQVATESLKHTKLRLAGSEEALEECEGRLVMSEREVEEMDGKVKLSEEMLQQKALEMERLEAMLDEARGVQKQLCGGELADAGLTAQLRIVEESLLEVPEIALVGIVLSSNAMHSRYCPDMALSHTNIGLV